MEKTSENTNGPGRKPGTDEQIAFDDNMVYPTGEDIYNRSQKEENIDPENITAVKEPNVTDDTGKNNEKDFTKDKSGDDLDVPGAELDDDQEIIGSEDEENNYYSLGGDNHNDLDEDKGE